MLLENTNTTSFIRYLKQFEEVLVWSLEHSSLSATLLFRMLIIGLFASTDAWRYIRDNSCIFELQLWVDLPKAGFVTESQLLGWIVVFVLLLHVTRYTAIPTSPNKSRILLISVLDRSTQLALYIYFIHFLEMVSNATGK